MDSRKFVGRALGLAVAVCALLGGAAVASAQVTIVTVPVGDPGNAPDTQVMFDGTTGYGAVSYAYNIGKYDVTVGQYTTFLNAVAKTDTYGLYNTSMGSGDPTYGCGISQTGSPGSYIYAPTKNPNFPVNYVSFWDACRFTNWLQNGQPTGAEGVGTTETGAYDLTVPNGITNNTITRSTGATWAVASENEWYKAAYYDPNKNGVGQAGYWAYPTKSDSVPSNVLSATGTNNTNYYDYYGTGNGGYTDPVNYLTAVGAFAASPSAYGTFDQGGDVFQWNDTSISGSDRGLRGGSFGDFDGYLQSGYRYNLIPTNEYLDIGFRVSQVPEPASLGILGFGVMGMLVRRRGGRR
jgi:formylglycine-generating enzyme required for sulfatase activity